MNDNTINNNSVVFFSKRLNETCTLLGVSHNIIYVIYQIMEFSVTICHVSHDYWNYCNALRSQFSLWLFMLVLLNTTVSITLYMNNHQYCKQQFQETRHMTDVTSCLTLSSFTYESTTAAYWNSFSSKLPQFEEIHMKNSKPFSVRC